MLSTGGCALVDRSTLLGTFADFAARLVLPGDRDATLKALVEESVAAMQLVGAGVLLIDGDRLTRAASAGPEAEHLDAVQEKLQSGPAFDAYRTNDAVVSDLSSAARRWPEFGAAAAKHSVRTVACVPMSIDSTALGVLSLYAGSARDWSADLDAAVVLAQMTTSFIVNADRYRRQATRTEQLQHALDYRVVVEQAKGILAQANGTGVDEAFDRIRRYARSHNASVRDVSNAIVAAGMRI